MSDSTTRERQRKAGVRPPKPYKDFPLSAHKVGQWCKKIRGKIRYFGRWGRVVKGQMERVPGDGWKEALDVYTAQKDDLFAGRRPRPRTDQLTVAQLANAFMTSKKRKLESKELAAPSFRELKSVIDLVVNAFSGSRLVDDLLPADFEALRATMSKRWGPISLGNAVQRARSLFKYGYESGLIEKPIRFGSEFTRPSRLVLRRHRARNGEKLLSAEEIRRMLDATEGLDVLTGKWDEGKNEAETVKLEPNPTLRAMILLGINAGFGGGDCANLPFSALNLETGWLDFPRPKTGIPRRCKLWPETVEALKAAVAARPEPRDEAFNEFVFLTGWRRPWLSRGTANPTSVAMRKLMQRVGVHRPTIGFYTLRHVFRTVADESRDPVAIDLVMGHADSSMGATYRERIDDSRLEAVVEHVRRWLFDESGKIG